MKQLITIFLLTWAFGAAGQEAASQRASMFNLEKSLAIQGYDPVAYFLAKDAVKGSSKIALKYLGVWYYFESERNKKLFEAAPTKYEPQYGGWCAYAMGYSGQKVEIDPQTFKILDGKLYLFYNSFFNNTLKSWNKTEKSLKTAADRNWINLSKK
jgi:YHS domain-containing protein